MASDWCDRLSMDMYHVQAAQFQEHYGRSRIWCTLGVDFEPFGYLPGGSVTSERG